MFGSLEHAFLKDQPFVLSVMCFCSEIIKRKGRGFHNSTQFLINVNKVRLKVRKVNSSYIAVITINKVQSSYVIWLSYRAD